MILFITPMKKNNSGLNISSNRHLLQKSISNLLLKHSNLYLSKITQVYLAQDFSENIVRYYSIH